MNIGIAAKASGVSAKMIRYYEEIGLIPPAGRTSAGYRDYSASNVHELRFIRRSRDLGFSVAEITNLLGLWRNRDRHSADVRRIAAAHIADLRGKIEGLRQMADTLQTLIDCCAGDHRPDCPILDELTKPAAGDHCAAQRQDGPA